MAHSRITSQKKMRQIRGEIQFCYLCGEELPARDKSGCRQQVTGEHVIPRSLLGDVPKDSTQAWAVELTVHRSCEQSRKQHVDHWLKLLQEIHVKPPRQWAGPGHLRNLPVYPSQVTHPDTGDVLPAFSGCSVLLDGVWQWIRGIHAALYREFLPSDVRHRVLPPVPACNNQGNGPTLEETERFSQVTLAAVSLAESLDKWDGIAAWGGAMQYRCVWWQRRQPGVTAGTDWTCFWTLTFPLVDEWSRQVLQPGSERPWHGAYSQKSRPSSAAWLRSEDFAKTA